MRLSLDYVALSVDSSKFDARELHDTFVYLAFNLWYLKKGHSPRFWHQTVGPVFRQMGPTDGAATERYVAVCLAVRKLLGATRPISMKETLNPSERP